MDKAKLDLFLNAPELNGMNTDEKINIEFLLDCPGKIEFFFFRQLIGKTPAQVRSLMLDEFIRRFNLSGYATQIMSAFPSKRSWRELDIMASQFAKRMIVEEHLLFWDRMRYLLAALPKRKEHIDKYEDKESLATKRPKKGWHYTTCKFCWRSVPYNPKGIKKTASLCFVHHLPSTHSIYRKHNRLFAKLFAEQQVIVKRVVELISNCSSDEDVFNTIHSTVTTPNDCLPCLVEYLDNVGHDGTLESLLWAFHGPACDMKDALYKEAIGEFIHTLLTMENPFNPDQPVPLIFSIDELSLAEAWLTLLDRDGRRKKS